MGGWQQIAPLPTPLERACAVYHPGQDKVYLFGGANQISGVNRTTYILDPNTNTWSSAALAPTGLTGNYEKAFLAADGKIHVLNTAGWHYRYDPDTNTWDSRASVPVGTAGSWLGFQDASSRIILIRKDTSVARRYDPTTDAWAAIVLPSIVPEGQYNTVGVLGDDGWLYSGFQTFCRNLIKVDLGSPTSWARTPDFPQDGWGSGGYNVPVSRLPNGIILRLANNQGSGRVRRIDGYNPATGLWSMGVIPDFIGPVYDYPAVATDPAGRIWVIGGEDNFDDTTPGPSKSASYLYLPNRAPTAATLLTLTGDALVSTAAVNRARHQFNDPDTGDSQSKFDWRYRKVGDASWTTGTAAWPNPWHDIAAGDLTPGNYERQIRTYDAAGLAAPWTASGFFTAADPPDGPTITYPINGQELEQLERVDWSAVAQDSYQVRRLADDGGAPDESTVYFDTGEVADPLARTLPLEFATNGRTEHVQVRVKDGGLWSDWVSVSADVSYSPPPAPTFTAYPDPATASILLMITNPDPTGDDPAAAYNDIYIDDGSGFERKATELATNAGWRYWTPKSGRDYAAAIRVVAVAANGTTSSSDGETG